MSSRRIRIALAGLVVLVVVGWLIRDLTSGHHTAGLNTPVSYPVSYSVSHSVGTQAGGRFWPNAAIPS